MVRRAESTAAVRTPGTVPASAHLNDERYNAATIAASTLAGLVEYAEAQRRDPVKWFAGSALTPGDCFDPDARLSFREVVSIVRAAQHDFPDAALGLAVGSRATLPALGVLGYSLMSSPTFSAALAVGEKYHPVTGSLMDVGCRIAGGDLVLEALERFPEPEIRRFLCEKFFASTLATWRALLAGDCQPRRLELSYAEPACAAEYRRLFRCPVHFFAGHNRMYADPAMLGRKIQTHSASGHAEALRLCQSKMPEPVGEVASLRAWLRKRLGSAPKIEAAARALGCSERTLRRRLGAAGTSFRAIHDGLRAERAQALLRDPRMGMAEIGGQLGYSDDREFRRAYKRWTGQLPREVRNNHSP